MELTIKDLKPLDWVKNRDVNYMASFLSYCYEIILPNKTLKNINKNTFHVEVDWQDRNGFYDINNIDADDQKYYGGTGFDIKEDGNIHFIIGDFNTLEEAIDACDQHRLDIFNKELL